MQRAFAQFAAIVSARIMLHKHGGGTLILRDFNGRIKDRMKINPNNIVSVMRIEGAFK
ncbi:MAG: hypothetical protein KA801_12365 [Syntrophorhabdaceae bacterium]|nr:hypothetical protein [Syntrophorhabdaceae bacterium]